MSKKLRFRDDGTFKIVQFSDVEIIDGEIGYGSKTMETMERVVQDERPDLIVFAGDVIASGACKNHAQALCDAVSVAVGHGIPWAAVFGNHDSEVNITREQLHFLQLSLPHNVAQPDPEGVNGVGNFVLNVSDNDGNTEAVLYFLDSGEYSPLSEVGLGGYDWIRRSQIAWYVDRSRERTMNNGGKPVPSLAFFHIPFPEYKELWDHHVCYGIKNDPISSPALNSGLFTAMKEMGDIMGTFVGHDHDNDFWGTLHGIRLCYGRSTKYALTEGFVTGARVIKLTAGQRDFQTWIRLGDGSLVTEQPEHHPESR
ncbi:metallophosphoesterase family protein [Paenibacillus macquariensis]|uniref:Calcineurin-like phosphoesterase n=1 Tax=Paenibacillus macquariensis TaxID=948756 RepID=A0ABY1JUZ6_9BACL|nr:metallophosphoesterase family protein [Paenibacillus macquariensis]MEC0090870.1 metallophosphoesterase family protein [Paenibacillus macquariensis]OAB34602.1 metallophosphoesterase [Paenibacillus macquariensis subsp. macquariensis]SIQ81731.1 Calcineurin-like phosphoesterase [Paenibacillus macquariensis]